jgi:glycosyltransferase involved in cell wall biosynthesis
MRVLLALAQLPVTEGGAAGRCAVGLLRGLRGHELDVVALAARHPSQSAFPDPSPEDRVEVVRVPASAEWRSRLGRFARPRGQLSRGPFAARLREAALDCDVLHLEEVDTAWCDRGVDRPSVVHMQYFARLDAPWGLPWSPRFRFNVEATAAEFAAARRHRHLIANSARMADEFRRIAPRAEVVVVPLTLDPADYEQALLDGPPVAGVIGTATWASTGLATRRLVEHVWPRVRRESRDATLRVAGRRMADLVTSSPGEGVEVVGEVDSASAFLRGLSLLLFPVDRGSGMKVKVLEALASGVPVVTTPVGAEGFEGVEGVVVESTEEGLVRAAVELLRDGAARRELGEQGRQAFLRRFAPLPATEPAVELYRRMLG